MKDRRLLLVVAAGILIGLVCVVRVLINKPLDYEQQVAAATVMRPAPPFEALDAENHLVRLASWLGRHRIIVLFFNGERGADQDSDLLRLRDRYAELQSQDVKVVGVTTALPQENRAAMERAGGAFPFPLVSDFDPQSPEGMLRIHRHWGRMDPSNEKPLSGAFLIDRKGQVAHLGSIPKPYDNVDQIFDLLAK
ncbi:redoxin domain-containing protein [Schlesneria paludicola]|uniref:redoxin domain-containing protein n=1 Tax=Schlesneria paludicola TaxID=360056 RepID=UPI00029B2E4A|nr:redoxin domain-containing protein [Schlesneria paludicola]